jgi:hypothetical protein
VEIPEANAEGRKHLYPCLGDAGTSDACPVVSYFTPDEIKAQEEEMARAVTQYITDLAAARCPFCGAEIKQEKQVGRCVYAMPCGHRLFVGRAGKGKR